MIKLLILADDFTGGLDTGVQFASRGISTCVATDPETDFLSGAGESQVLVIVAETRHLPADEAYRAVFSVVSRAVDMGIPHIYKKIDSALRGNIGAELTAALDASKAPMLAFVPALPSMNRVTRGGIHYVDGVPVADSVFGQDPFEPVRESEIAQLIALQSKAAVQSVTPDELPDFRGIAVLDASSGEDLRQVGQAVAAADGLRLMAGCAGFAAVLPELLQLNVRQVPKLPVLDSGLFVLCGSVNPITQRQLDYGESCGFQRIHIRPEEKLHPEWFGTPEGAVLLERWKRRMLEEPWMILDANDRDPSNRETADLARSLGWTAEDIRQRISASLGVILSAMVQQDACRTLLITGGDTLLQSMNRMGVSRMMPLTEVFPGVVISRVHLGNHSWFVMTKSGGFGEETLLADLKELIESQRRCSA